MPFFRDAYNYAKKNNIIFGIIFTDLIAFIAYLFSNGVSFIVLGDIHMLFGSILGVYFSLKYRKQNQSPLLYGILVGLVGTFFSALTLTLFQWTYILNINFSIFYIYIIPAIIIGPLVGAIFGLIFRIKEKDIDKSSIDEEFFKDLEED